MVNRSFSMSTALAFMGVAATSFVSSCAEAQYIYSFGSSEQGNQDHIGSLGQDFNLIEPIRITELGVFDSGGDGFSSGTTLNVRIYDRTQSVPGEPSLGAIMASAAFTSTTVAPLEAGSYRMFSLTTPIVLPTGFRGSLVADGFTSNDPNINRFLDAGIAGADIDTSGAIQFTGDDLGAGGTARFSSGPGGRGLYPRNLFQQNIAYNVFGQATFKFAVVPAPSGLLTLLIGAIPGAMLLRCRRKNAAG